MRNFFRVLKLSRPYLPRLIISLAAALLVAVLWSLNLSAIFPVLKILSADKNLQTWVKEEIDETERQAGEPTRIQSMKDDRALIEFLNQHPATEHQNRELRERTKQLAQNEGELNELNTRLYRLRLLQDKVIVHVPTNRFETFVWIIVAVVVCVVVKGFFEFWQDFLVGSVVNRTLFDLRNKFYRAAIHQDTRQLQEVGTPELMARVTNDIEQIGGGMKILYGKMVVEPLKAIACLFAACLISWELTVVFILLVAPAVVCIGRVSRIMKKASRKVLEHMSNIYKILRETFDGIKVVKAFTMEPAERRRFRNATEDYYQRSMRVIKIDALAGPLVEIFGVAAVGLALLAGAYLVLEKQTTIFGMKMTDGPMGFETLLQLYVFLAAIADPVRRLSSVYTKIQGGAAAADRTYALFDRVPKVTANADGPAVPKHAESIDFKNVCFSYVPGQDTLNSITLSVKAGETIALVGPNGCGKTTLLGLLPRFYDPDHGSVSVDGVVLRGANLRSLRRQIGIVTQDTVLFNDTIFANIAYGKPGATAEEVEAAAKKAFAHEFIVLKPKGYQEQVGDLGSSLSGGQKQRLALARAIVRDPRILILDEFTSQIDPDSEAKIQQALKEFVVGRTTFLITHRLSTLELADRIVVMDSGRVEGIGTHQELLATCLPYQRLYEAHISGMADGDRVPTIPGKFRVA